MRLKPAELQKPQVCFEVVITLKKELDIFSQLDLEMFYNLDLGNA